MAELSLYAEAFRYPFPGQRVAFLARLEELPESPGRGEYTAFLQALRPLSQGEWEELYTSTLDLNPEFAPYLGYQMWGDSYKRGSFMSQLSKVMLENEINRDGELPDHLVPVLRYLDQVPEPIPDLAQILEPALEKMAHKLQKDDPVNPYLHLLQAVQLACNRKNK
jgi:nitrate reductase delta subunit